MKSWGRASRTSPAARASNPCFLLTPQRLSMRPLFLHLSFAQRRHMRTAGQKRVPLFTISTAPLTVLSLCKNPTWSLPSQTSRKVLATEKIEVEGSAADISRDWTLLYPFEWVDASLFDLVTNCWPHRKKRQRTLSGHWLCVFLGFFLF